MHPEIYSFLQDRGLTDTEIKIYTEGLASGQSTVSDIAKRSAVRRTTVYSALSSLEKKGMTSCIDAEEVKQYTMTAPEQLEQQLESEIAQLEDQKNSFSEIVPLFSKLSSLQAEETYVQHFTGEKGVQTAIDQALFCKTRSWKIIAPFKNYFSESSKSYADYFIRIRKQRNIQTKSLWEQSFVQSRKFSESTIDQRNPKIIPRTFEGTFKCSVILFDTKVLFIESKKNESAVVIHSKDVFNIHNIFFDHMWSEGKKIPLKRMKEIHHR